MPKGWKQIGVSTELYDIIKDYYESHKDELKLRHGVRNRSAFIAFIIREYMKEKGII